MKDITMDSEQKKKKQELRDRILEILGILWLQSRLDTKITIADAYENASEIDDRHITLRDYLLEVRKMNSENDFKYNPEKSYLSLEARSNVMRLVNFYLAYAMIAMIVAMIIGYFNYSTGTWKQTLEFCIVTSVAASISSIIVYVFNLYKWYTLKATKASKLIGEMWRVVREKYITAGFVDTVVDRLLEDRTLALSILTANNFPQQISAGKMLREMFQNHFVDVAVPYVESCEDTTQVELVAAIRAKDDSGLMSSLIPFMGFDKDQGSIITDAYQLAYERIKKWRCDDDVLKDDDTIHIPFPSPTYPPKAGMSTVWGEPPPKDAA